MTSGIARRTARATGRAALAAVVLAALVSGGCKGPKAVKLYAGAGLRPAVDELVAEFEKQTGIRVEPDYSGGGVSIARVRDDPEADLFMPGDVWYVDRLDELSGRIESKTSVCYFVPVIIVAKGNPKKITGLADLFGGDLRIALGNPKACQVGRLTDKIFKKNGLDRSALTARQSLTVNELGVWVKMGAADAAIVWDAIAANVAESVDVVEIPREKNIISHVVVGLLKTSRDKAPARRFVDFVTGEKGREILRKKGYQVDPP